MQVFDFPVYCRRVAKVVLGIEDDESFAMQVQRIIGGQVTSQKMNQVIGLADQVPYNPQGVLRGPAWGIAHAQRIKGNASAAGRKMAGQNLERTEHVGTCKIQDLARPLRVSV